MGVASGFQEFAELVLGELGDAVFGEVAGVLTSDSGEKALEGVCL